MSGVNAGGTKYDGGKPDMALLDSEWLLGVSEVLTFGKKKYAAQNWRGGLEVMRLLSAALRHIFAFLGGEDKDPESGLPHLHHASCCLMFASWMVKNRPQLDDRYKMPDTSVTPTEEAPRAEEERLPAAMPTMRINRPYAP